MTDLLLLASIIGYAVIGVVTFVRMIPVCYRRQMSEYPKQGEQSAREDAFLMALWRAVLWPYGLFYELALKPLARLAWRPVDERKARAEQLRADAAAWREKRSSGTEVERQMAGQLAALCDQMANEIDR